MTYRSRCEGRRRVPGHIVEDIRFLWRVTRAIARAIARQPQVADAVETRWSYFAPITGAARSDRAVVLDRLNSGARYSTFEAES